MASPKYKRQFKRLIVGLTILFIIGSEVYGHFRGQHSEFYSITAILLALSLSYWLDRYDLESRLDAFSENMKAISSISFKNAFFCFKNAQHAVQYVINSLPSAEAFYNTRTSGEEAFGTVREEVAQLIQATVAAINKGTYVEEVMSESHKESADLTRKSLQKNVGKYRVRIIPDGIPLMHFAILDYGNDSRELIFGWAIHNDDRASQSLFRTDDQHLVTYFMDYHKILMKYGKSMTSGEGGRPARVRDVKRPQDRSRDTP